MDNLLRLKPGSTGLAITFDDIDADTLERFVQWLLNPARMGFAKTPNDHSIQLARLFAFGDRITAPMYANLQSRLQERNAAAQGSDPQASPQ